MSNIGISGGLQVEKSNVGKNLMPKETVIYSDMESSADSN